MVDYEHCAHHSGWIGVTRREGRRTRQSRRRRPIEQQVVRAIHEHVPALIVHELRRVDAWEDEFQRIRAVAE